MFKQTILSQHQAACLCKSKVASRKLHAARITKRSNMQLSIRSNMLRKRDEAVYVSGCHLPGSLSFPFSYHRKPHTAPQGQGDGILPAPSPPPRLDPAGVSLVNTPLFSHLQTF